MLTNFRPEESLEHPGEIAIYADESSTGRTVVCVVARDALADLWHTTTLDSRATRYLVQLQIDKFGLAVSAKYKRAPASFEQSPKYPSHFTAVLTASDFDGIKDLFTKADVLAAAERSLGQPPRGK